MTKNYSADHLSGLTMKELYNIAKKYSFFNFSEIDRNLALSKGRAYDVLTKNSSGSMYVEPIKNYLIDFIIKAQAYDEITAYDLYRNALTYKQLTYADISNELKCSKETVSKMIKGDENNRKILELKEYLHNIIENAYQNEQNKALQENTIQEEEAQMTEETIKENKEMKTYDDFLNFIDSQKSLPIVKKALNETLTEKQNLDKILAKEEFITIETAKALNEKIFANEYTEEEIIDFELQYNKTTKNNPLKENIKAFVKKHNLSLETALKLLQISEEDYKKMLEGADKVSAKTADKIYAAISAFDEFYHSEKAQKTINTTKDTFATGFAIASAKSQTLFNKGLNKFADLLNKGAEKIKNSNSENKED